MSRRPPIKLPQDKIEQIYANIGLCYVCGRVYVHCTCNPTPARLPPQTENVVTHRTPGDYDSPDPIARAEADAIVAWLNDNWDDIPEIPF